MTNAAPEDPIGRLGIAGYAAALRRGEISAVAATRGYLARIERLDPELQAYQSVLAASALKEAAAVDALVAAGVDLGPLMGVPVAVKDILAVTGSRTTAGSLLDLEDLVGPEGPFVRRLRACGCIIIGKTRTTEFAFSASGINASRGTPRNPRDPVNHRLPGGSSSGSGVAVAAGLCGFAIGSDTGGSVRIPAAVNGVVGLKTSVGLWSTDGVFALSTTFDTIGLLTATVADAMLAFTAIQGSGVIAASDLDAARLAVPRSYYMDNLDPAVAEAFERALRTTEGRGAKVRDIDMPEAAERVPIMGQIMASDLIASMGRDRLFSQIERVDPAVASRIRSNGEVRADEYVRNIRRHRELTGLARGRMEGFDLWATPTVPCTARTVAEAGDPDQQLRLVAIMNQNTMPGNLFGQCGLSIPLGTSGLPAGLQLMANAGDEVRLLAIGQAVEAVLGTYAGQRAA